MINAFLTFNYEYASIFEGVRASSQKTGRHVAEIFAQHPRKRAKSRFHGVAHFAVRTFGVAYIRMRSSAWKPRLRNRFPKILRRYV